MDKGDLHCTLAMALSVRTTVIITTVLTYSFLSKFALYTGAYISHGFDSFLFLRTEDFPAPFLLCSRQSSIK